MGRWGDGEMGRWALLLLITLLLLLLRHRPKPLAIAGFAAAGFDPFGRSPKLWFTEIAFDR
jgi:hypothetical protein